MPIRNKCAVTLIIAVLLLLGLPVEILGRRLPPKPVGPVIDSGIEYSAEGNGRIGWIAATDVSGAKKLWTVRVFRIHTHFWKEEDNQLIFISDLNLDHGALLIKDERSRCYRLDLSTKRVKNERCR